MLIKHALKVGIAAAILGAVFQNAPIDHIAYPAMGLVTTLQSSMGDSFKAAWGRLGGSAIGGIIGALMLSIGAGGALSVGLASILAGILCQGFGFPTLYNQALTVSSLLSANVYGHGENPWIYAANRVFDNWIGVAIGFGVNYLFWRENPAQTLSKNLSSFLEKIEGITERIAIGAWPSPETIEREREFLQAFLHRGNSVLSASLYGRLGMELVEENWNTIVIIQKKLLRYLSGCLTLWNQGDRSFLQELSENFPPLWQEIARYLEGFVYRKRIFFIERSERLASTRNALQQLIDRVRSLRDEGAIDRHSIRAINTAYQFIFNLTKFIDELEKLHHQLEFKNSEIPRQKFQIRWRPIPEHKWKLLLKTGLCISLTVAIVDDWLRLPYNYYAVLAVIISMQPTFGKTINAGKQRGICTAIGAVMAFGMIHLLGSNIITLGVGITLTILVCSYFGFTTGYKPALILFISAILLHSSESDFYILSRFWETLLGVAIGTFFYPLFWFRSAAHELNESLEKTIAQLQERYRYLLDRYLEDSSIDADSLTKKREISQAIENHRILRVETRQEGVENFLASRKVKFWDTLMSYEENLSVNLALLEEAIEQNLSRNYRQRYEEELTAIAQRTLENLQCLHSAIANGTAEAKITPAAEYFQRIESQRWQARQSDRIRQFSLEEAIAFITIVSLLQDIDENLAAFRV
jgi:uncharacterized membrane protein YgaE (UPF0421/DUF939 family)